MTEKDLRTAKQWVDICIDTDKVVEALPAVYKQAVRTLVMRAYDAGTSAATMPHVQRDPMVQRRVLLCFAILSGSLLGAMIAVWWLA